MTENDAQSPEIQEDLTDLARRIEEAGSFEMYMGSAPKLAAQIDQITAAARAVKAKHVDIVSLSEGSRSDAKASFVKLVHRLADLTLVRTLRHPLLNSDNNFAHHFMAIP